jgi:tetratricopeptide (TPR) repeat protein
VRQFRGTTVPLPQIARELNVDAVIEGSVLRSGNRIRITTQLVDARTDSHLWAQSYERDIGESLEIQDSAALDIANQVRVTLTPRQRQPFEARRSVTPDAYEAYLKGIYFQNRQTPDDVQSAIRFFRTATEKDPGYAAAYARLADAYMLLAFVSEVPSAEAFTRARESAEKALSLDESLDEGHVEVANIAFFHDWDWRKAEGEFKRAIELNPNSASARYTYPILLLVSGRSKQSVEEARAAQALDPVSPSSYLVAVSVAYYSRQYDDGLRLARAALELYPNNPVLRVLHGNEGFAIFLANVVNRADVVMI